ncbi:hypothetical protein D9M71_668930 [compost metagenome]
MQACSDVQGHLVTTMRHYAARRPTHFFHHLQGAHVLHEPVGQCTVELEIVAIRAHATVTQQVTSILVGEQVFTRSHWQFIVICQFSLQCVVQRIANFFVPEEVVLFDGFRVRNACLQIEAAIGIDRQSTTVPYHFKYRLDTTDIFVQ